MPNIIEIQEELETLDLPELPSLSKTLIEQKVDEATEEELGDLTDEEFAALASEAARVQDAIDALTERKEELKVTARRLPYGKNERKGVSLGSVSIGRNPQFDREKFEAAHPYDHYEVEEYVAKNENGNSVIRKRMVFPNQELYKIEPNRPKIKELLPKEEVDTFYNEGTKKVTFNR